MSESRLSEEWIAEISRETEHYYQGELQQETRASWLIATASAIIAAIVSVGLFLVEQNVKVCLIQFLIPTGLFSFSLVMSILGMMPFLGTKGPFYCAWARFNKAKTLEATDLAMTRFGTKGKWDEENLREYLFEHFKSHHVRNLQKSIFIRFSCLFMALGIIALISELVLKVIGII